AAARWALGRPASPKLLKCSTAPMPMRVPPDLSSPCGEHFAYRDLIACGETWHRLTAEAGGEPFDNVPRAAETLQAMPRPRAGLPGPAVRQFGRIALTWGFASRALTRHIAGRIHPPADQHAGHEVGAGGRLVCPRLGLAADFVVPGTDSRVVARWVAERTAFD